VAWILKATVLTENSVKISLHESAFEWHASAFL